MGLDDLIVWGGSQDDLPYRVHDNRKKRLLTTRLDVLHLPSMEWNSILTNGTPPAGALDYCTTTIGDKELYLFDGGRCDSGACVHNDLYQLNTSDKVWKRIPCTNKPMKKHSCGLISYSCEGSDYLLAQGGMGGKQPPAEPQLHSLYTPGSDGNYTTNEVHIMNMTTSPGQWISPTITGNDRPLSISHFSLHLLPHSLNQAIMFGGWTTPDKGRQWQCSNETYSLSLTDNTVHFTKLSPAGAPSPIPRVYHASTIISTDTQDHLLVIGGRRDDIVRLGSTLAECWILDPVSRRWSEVSLPESVCGRCHHSVSSVTLNTNTVWIIVTGGRGMRGTINSAEVAMVVELVYNNSWWYGYWWKVGGVWNATQQVELTERMKRLRATNTRQPNKKRMEEQEIAHLSQRPIGTTQQQQKDAAIKSIELQRNTEVLQKKDTTILTKDQQPPQKDATIHRLEQELEQNTKALQEKDVTIQAKDQQQLQKDATIHRLEQELEQNTQAFQEKDATIQAKDEQLQQKDATIQQLQSDIREKDNTIEQSLLQIQHKDDLIQRHEGTITQQQREITGYHDNPSWLIERDEITMTGEVLGRGGWGEVKVGVFRGTKVAVKTLHEVIVNDYYLQLFSREMDVASRVRHPNLLQFIGATRMGQLMIITELMPTSLRRELEKHSLLQSQVISIASDVVSALNYLHSFRPHPILHRDVSSANILLEPSAGSNWKGKLSDYGSANLMDNISTSNPGSPVYSAPEASTPSLHSAAMDIYSFGILLTEMATGQFPSPVAHEREGSIQNIKSSTVKKLVIQCTSTDPSLRPPTDTVLALLR